VLGKQINTVVLTSTLDEAKRNKLLSKGVVDYIVKEGQHSYQYAIDLIERLNTNRDTKVLIADDSDTSRYFLRNLLNLYCFQTIEAKNGSEAMQTLLENPDTKLMITDYKMPEMDGFELVQTARTKFAKSDLAIIGLSGDGEGALTARFLKAGANDCLCKPFNNEEFHWRVRHNIEMLEYIEHLRYAANRDQATGLYNRRYFVTEGNQLHERARHNESPLAAVILELDEFEKIRDTHGYEGGDKVLCQFAGILKEAMGRFLLARPRGGEFFVLLAGLDNSKAMTLLSRVREIVNANEIHLGDTSLYATFSAGITNHLGDSLTEQLNTANDYLSRAKNAGHNFIVGDDADGDG